MVCENRPFVICRYTTICHAGSWRDLRLRSSVSYCVKATKGATKGATKAMMGQANKVLNAAAELRSSVAFFGLGIGCGRGLVRSQAAMRAQSAASYDAAPSIAVTKPVNDLANDLANDPASNTVNDPVDSPVKGSNEFEVWSSAGGAVPINGSIAPITEWNLGARYGRVLTDAHGPSLLNGRFEYSFDVVPAFLVFQHEGGHNAALYNGGKLIDPFAQ